MRPLVSVIIPTYNNERQLPRCIDSLLAQTYGNFELIAVDDGSTDGSGSVLDAYAERDARIRVIHRKNGGVSSARNVGIDDAKGEYVTFVDGDDAVDPSYIEHLAGALRQDGTAISSCIISRETENEAVTFSEVRKTGEHITTRVFGLADCAERVRYGSFNSCGVM
ncbi:MAG: glycosyltransferase, partial [Acutalibacteraceae bacterium]|nr:glycosyltransferase [Acutalibacteraceae bacterium]